MQECNNLLERIDLSLNKDGIDPYGVSRNYLKMLYPVMKWLYRHYFRVRAIGTENVPDEGPVMLVGNHSGGIPVDGTMTVMSMIIDHDPPRYPVGMVDRFAQKMPIVSPLLIRLGQVTGVREQAERLLNEGRVLLIFPEGIRGIGKLYKDRYKLVDFTSGFMRLALKTGAPVVPFAFIGGEEAIPTIMHARKLGNLLGAPYFPITPYILPLPLPVPCQIYFGEAMYFKDEGSCEDVAKKVELVKTRVEGLIETGLKNRVEETEQP
ncbi:MAG: acyltransferase family protein [Firmicutes bacterium]|nr:acyltransferase family protein [Bacillota bacterium]